MSCCMLPERLGTDVIQLAGKWLHIYIYTHTHHQGKLMAYLTVCIVGREEIGSSCGIQTSITNTHTYTLWQDSLQGKKENNGISVAQMCVFVFKFDKICATQSNKIKYEINICVCVDIWHDELVSLKMSVFSLCNTALVSYWLPKELPNQPENK